MSVILVLIPLSIVFAAAFLAAFIWAVRSGQYEDTCTPSMRLLLDEPVRGEGPPAPGEAAGARPSPGAATSEALMAGTGFTAPLDSRDSAPGDGRAPARKHL